MGLAITFIHSTFGLFNQMQAFFTLFNIPVTVPLAFGLIFRKIPKWAAWIHTLEPHHGRGGAYLLGWDIGPQVYLSTILSFGVLLSSPFVADLYRTRKALLWTISILISAVLATIFALSPGANASPWGIASAIACAVVLVPTLVPLARLFARDTEEEKKEIVRFYEKLDTPVNVQAEVYGAGRRQVATLPVVGRTIVFLGVLVALAFLNTLGTEETIAVIAMMTILLGFGGTLWIAGKRVQMREARELALSATRLPDGPCSRPEGERNDLCGGVFFCILINH